MSATYLAKEKLNEAKERTKQVTDLYSLGSILFESLSRSHLRIEVEESSALLRNAVRGQSVLFTIMKRYNHSGIKSKQTQPGEMK